MNGAMRNPAAGRGVSRAECFKRHTDITKCLNTIEKKQDEVLVLLRGDTKDRSDQGLVGDVMDLKGSTKFDRKVLYSVVGIGITLGIGILAYFLTAGGV